jgi:hypothetical protein
MAWSPLREEGALMVTHVTVFWHDHRRLVLWLVLCVVAVFVLFFEVGVRLITPDALQYDVQVTNNGGPIITRTGTITNPTTIAGWRAQVTQTPSGQWLPGTLIREWRKQDLCAPLSNVTASYTFLWHGMVIEQVSSLPVCTEEHAISRGGLPDLRTYFVPLLVQS